MKILLTGGGTGGHAMPIVAVYEELKKISEKEIEFLWIGSKRGIENELAEKNKIEFKTVMVGKVRRYFSLQNVIDFIKIPLGIIQSFFIISKFKPDVIFSKGGYVSIPPVIAGWFLGVPSITHESDVKPGLANKLLSTYVKKIALGFEYTKNFVSKERSVWTGVPLTNEIMLGSKKRGTVDFNLEYQVPVILVIGGSQGAKVINDTLLDILPEILKNYQVIHICGKNNIDEVKDEIKNKNLENSSRYHLYSFLAQEKMGDAYASANVVVSRAGASSLAEIAFFGRASILIPLSTVGSRGDQIDNAKIFAEAGAAIVIEENILNKNLLAKEINVIFEQENKYEGMSVAAQKLAKKDARDLLAKEILKLAKKNG